MTTTYARSPLPSDLAESLAGVSTRPGAFAADVHWYEQLPSTNDVALRLAEQGAAEGTTVMADAQTAGRGRRGRTWASPPGAGLYVSVVLRPDERAAPLVTIAGGVAIADGLLAATGLRVTLKWPNDVYANGRKLAGILAEGAAGSAGGPYVVLGFGINRMPAAYPPDVAARATSLEGELGRPVDRGATLSACLSALADRCQQLRAGDSAGILRDWRAYAAATLGRRVQCTSGARLVEGIAQDIDEGGALLVRSTGGIVRVIAGEVIWL